MNRRTLSTRLAPLPRLRVLCGLLAATAVLCAAESASAACDAGGKWAARIDLPVTWRANAALKGGRGHITFAALIDRRPLAAPGHFAESITLCAVVQPATQTMALWGGERFAVHYDTAALSAEQPPTQAIAFVAGDAGEPGELPAYQVSPTAFEVGIRLPGGALASWPAGPEELEGALLQRGDEVGALAYSRSDESYVWPPIDYGRTRRAEAFWLASQAVLTSEANWQGCDAMGGTTQLGSPGGQSGLNSTLVGCRLADGGRCSAADLTLANMFQPNWRVVERGTFASVRLSGAADCAAVRSLLDLPG